MANRLKNFKITEDIIIIDDELGVKISPVLYVIITIFVFITGLKYYSTQGLDIISGFFLVLSFVLLVMLIQKLFKASFKTHFLSNDIIGIREMTAFTGHRSLKLLLKNGRYRDLYLEPSEIPMLIKKMSKYGVELQP